MNSFVRTVASGAFLSLLVELSQLLNNRRTDIDDLILNTTGAVIGIVFYRLLFKKTTVNDSLKENLKVEPFIYMAVMFICRFLFFDEIGTAKLLFGFKKNCIGERISSFRAY